MSDDDDFEDMTEDEFDRRFAAGEPAELGWWVTDETLSREETLARFEALDPEPTRGPHARTLNSSNATTYMLRWPEDAS